VLQCGCDDVHKYISFRVLSLVCAVNFIVRR